MNGSSGSNGMSGSSENVVYIKPDEIVNQEDFVKYKFELPEAIKNKLYNMSPVFGHNGLGELVFYRTYSRRKASGGQENWVDTIIRVVEGVMSIYKSHMITHYLAWSDAEYYDFIEEFAIYMFEMKFLPPGRGLWAIGTEYVNKRGSMALNNCAFATTTDLKTAVTWTMNALMCGCGVGFDTLFNGRIYKPTNQARFIVPDSREGWVESVGHILENYLKPNGYVIEFDYSQIRKEGSKINGFGGTASGPGPLIKLHERMVAYLNCYYRITNGMSVNDSICEMIKELIDVEESYNTDLIKQVKDIPNKTYGLTRLIADIFNAVGACVVAGNVRRSSEIALGKAADEEFRKLKDFTVNPERSPIMWMSNNTVQLEKTSDFSDYIPSIAKQLTDNHNGEPGIYNMINTKLGRVGKQYDDSDIWTREREKDNAIGINPCGEVPLESFELCDLAETFPGKCLKDGKFNMNIFLKAVEFATFYASVVSLLPTQSTLTNAVIARNHRIGVSLSGTVVVSEEIGYSGMVDVLKAGYKKVREINTKIMSKAGVPASIRVTVIKPSGTVSQLAGVPPGIHYPPESRYVIRRIRVSIFDKICQHLIKSGIPYEKDTYSDNTMVFEFPVDQGNTRSVKDVTVWEQLKMAELYQRWWADNSVSFTANYDIATEALYLEEAIATTAPNIKSVSFLPKSNTVYAQAPYEEISKEKYEELTASLPIIDWLSYASGSTSDGEMPLYCDGDKCIKL